MGTITDKLNKLAETKSAIKTAIVNKGVAVSDSDTFASYADKIASISGGGETPTEGIYGVFIYDTNGNLTKPEEWDTVNNDLTVGVAVIDENCSFIIGKEASVKKVWSNKLYGTTIPGIVTTDNTSTAKTDYAGEYNSSIVRNLTSEETNAFNWAYGNTITVNGTTLHGYIGALGEWYTAINNKSSIDSALKKIGGRDIDTNSNHWVSTQYSGDNTYTVNWYGGYLGGYIPKNYAEYYARAFYHLDYPQINDIISLNKYKFVSRPNQPITTGDFEYIISCTDKSYPRFENIEYNAKRTTLEYLYTNLNQENNYKYAPVGSITINAENCRKIYHLFGDVPLNIYSDGDLEVHINTSDKLTNLSALWGYAGNITISNTSKVTNFEAAFLRSISPELKEIDTSSGTNLSYILQDTHDYLIKIAGLSLKSLNTAIENYYFTGYGSMTKLRYALLKDLGTGSNCTKASFVYWIKWGIEDETVPLSAGARQSLIDTLITYSYDRATAGYSACTIYLYKDSKALLTQDEIAQMTAKGYTLA